MKSMRIARMLDGDEWYCYIPSFPGVGVTIADGSQSETRAGTRKNQTISSHFAFSHHSYNLTASANCDYNLQCSFEMEALLG